MKNLANALNSRTCAEDLLFLFAQFVHHNEARSRKQLYTYLEIMYYVLPGLATVQTISKNNTTLLNYVPLSDINPQQYVADAAAKSCIVAEV